MQKKIVLFIFLFLNVYHYAQAQLIAYKAPKGSSLNNSFFTVKVRQGGHQWQSLPTYLATVANVVNTKSTFHATSFSYFDFSGTVEVSVTYNKGAIKSTRIRPLAFGINPKVRGNTLIFSLNRPRNLSIEVNGDIFNNLQLFANALETYKPAVSDSNVIYYGPGIHQVGFLKVPSNKTIYIAGGAIVQGRLLISNAENVRVLGHGILTQLPLPNYADKTASIPSNSSRNDQLTVEFSKNVEINGLIVLPHKYSVLIGQSAGVRINDLKSFSYEGNADGIDVFCSTNVAINNIFMRNSDDCIAIYGHRWAYYGNCSNISVSNAILWADIAHPILIGTHGDTQHPDTLANMKFKNIDVLDQHEHQIDYQGCLALNAGDSNLLNKLQFEDVRVDDIREGQLINIRVMFNRKYNTSAGQGINNVYFKNILYNGSRANPSVILGYDETRAIKNVVFENLQINGKVITDDMPGKPSYYKTGDMANMLIGEHAQDIRFVPSK